MYGTLNQERRDVTKAANGNPRKRGRPPTYVKQQRTRKGGLRGTLEPRRVVEAAPLDLETRLLDKRVLGLPPVYGAGLRPMRVGRVNTDYLFLLYLTLVANRVQDSCSELLSPTAFVEH
jgi:hypothetical protein